MMQWEYKIVEWKNLDDTWLNQYGARGWELVLVFDGNAVFKREAGYPPVRRELKTKELKAA
jgi:hypothetical protein